MSGGEKLRARVRPVHCATGVFEPGECMSPAYVGADGQMAWATYAPSEVSEDAWEVVSIDAINGPLSKQWAEAVLALGFVHQRILMRQTEIDKKEYATDETLYRLRRRAVAIHNRRIQINMDYATFLKAMDRMRQKLRSLLDTLPPKRSSPTP